MVAIAKTHFVFRGTQPTSFDQPAPPRRTHLRVISQSGVPAGPEQNCSTCTMVRNCWEPGIEDRVIMLNLLVCRMKRGIRLNAATKTFLELIRPKLAKMASQAIVDTGHDLADAIADFESAAVEYILKHYEIGEIAYPLHYLFGFPNGVMRRYQFAYREKLQRTNRTVSLDAAQEAQKTNSEASNRSPDTGHRVLNHPNLKTTPTFDEDLDDRKVTDRMDIARRILSDGKSLTAEQYRVLRFCLSNAKDGGFRRPLNGLHVFLAKAMGIPRAKVTKIYSDACARLVQATQGVL